MDFLTNTQRQVLLAVGQSDLAHLTARLIEAVGRLDEVRPLFIGQSPNPADLRVFFQTNANRYLRRRLK